MKRENYVLVTGGSSGLGKELASQCAARGWNVILVALPGGNAGALAEHIRAEYGVDACAVGLDLTDYASLAGALERLNERYRISFLINNAGIGGTASITGSPAEAIDRIIQLNVRATAMVTRLMLPYLLKHGRGHIMNIASMAAFTPIAYKTVYPASKAFISSFALGLREELRGSGVSVSVVYPGSIMTNSNVSRRIIGLGSKGRIGLLSVPEIARIALRKTLAGKAVIIPGVWNRINHQLMKLIPLETRLKLLSGAIKQELNFQ